MSRFGASFAAVICVVVILAGQSTGLHQWRPILYPNFRVNDRIIARRTNNLYYAGKVSSTANGLIRILFDDGNTITHSDTDISAVIADTVPNQVDIGDHVVTTWTGGRQYYFGYVCDKNSNNRWKVTFDDNYEDFYTTSQLRIFPDHFSAHDVGARVFARRTDGLYYRGFVTSASSTTVFINYDDGDTTTLQKKDAAAVILDKLPCYKDVQAGQRVIGFLPGTTRYYPGDVAYKRNVCSSSCYQKAVYRVLFDDHDDDTDQRVQDFHQIRLIPCSSSFQG